MFALSLWENVSWGLTYFDEFISTGDPYSTLLTQESGWISAPDENNDGHYDNGLYCYWHVEGQKGEKIKFEIVYSRLEDSPGCLLDFLTVKSRNIDKCFVFIAKLCAILKLQSFPKRWPLCKSNRKAMNRNWSNQKANPALKTKAGNK